MTAMPTWWVINLFGNALPMSDHLEQLKNGDKYILQ
jgi:hypothetical protein